VPGLAQSAFHGDRPSGAGRQDRQDRRAGRFIPWCRRSVCLAYIDQSSDWAWLPMADKIRHRRQLYAAAGYDERHRCRSTCRIMASDNVRKIANAVAGMWQTALGVKVTITAEDFNALVEHRHKKKPGFAGVLVRPGRRLSRRHHLPRPVHVQLAGE